MSEENVQEATETIPNEAENNEENVQDTQTESKTKRIRGIFAKNVKFGSERFKKGESTLMEKEQIEAFKKAGIID